MEKIKHEQELPLLLDAKDIQALGFSRCVAYQILNRTDVPVIQIRKRKLVNRDDFFAWLKTQRPSGGQS